MKLKINIISSKLFFVFFLGVMIISSCLKVEPEEVGVITENILFTSGEIMVVTGRILATSEISISDHGFEIDDTEEFTNPIEISLGERNLPGRFVGEYQTLSFDTDYFVRSYFEDSNGRQYGNTVGFATLEPIIDDFEPKIGFPREVVKISGRNFTRDAEVFFDNEKVERLSISNESFIEARIPEFGGEVFENITVVMGGESFSAPFPFEYTTGLWTQTIPFPFDEDYVANIDFRSGDEIIFGHGAINGFGPYVNNTFSYNINSQEWNSVFFPGPAAGFRFSTNGIVGSGSFGFIRPNNSSYSLNDDYYLYKGEGVFEYGGKTPFKLLKASAERIGDFAYIFGGLTEEIDFSSAIYRFNFNTETWDEIGELPFGLSSTSDYPSFVYQNKIYFIARNFVENSYNLYVFDPSTGIISFESDYPGDVTNSGIGAALGDKFYIGLFENRRDIYEYDFNAKSWKPKVRFPGNASDLVAAKWTVGNELFILKNNERDMETPAIWKFAPDEF